MSPRDGVRGSFLVPGDGGKGPFSARSLDMVAQTNTGAKGCPGAWNAAPSVLSLDSGIYLNVWVTKAGWQDGADLSRWLLWLTLVISRRFYRLNSFWLEGFLYIRNKTCSGYRKCTGSKSLVLDISIYRFKTCLGVWKTTLGVKTNSIYMTKTRVKL